MEDFDLASALRMAREKRDQPKIGPEEKALVGVNPEQLIPAINRTFAQMESYVAEIVTDVLGAYIVWLKEKERLEHEQRMLEESLDQQMRLLRE